MYTVGVYYQEEGGEGGDGHNCVNVRLEKFYKSDFLFYKTK